VILKQIEVSARMKEHDDSMQMQAANAQREDMNRQQDRFDAAQQGGADE
jgi:hypothetical protein